MTKSQSIDSKVSREELQRFLAGWIRARVHLEQLDWNATWSALGMSSLDTVGLSGALEDFLLICLPPELAQQFRSPQALLDHLSPEADVSSEPLAIPQQKLEPQSSIGESFDLSAFQQDIEEKPLRERARAFGERSAEKRGNYRRLVTSAAGPRVNVVGSDGRQRSLRMFGSNNYLGLATHPHVLAQIRKTLESHGAGLGGPPLLNGYTDLHRELESRLAALKKSEAALVFSSGFGANLGLISGLGLRASDRVFFDASSHASLLEGLRSCGARSAVFGHNRVDELEALLLASEAKDGERFVAVEGVYSMDGDLAPLPQITELCRRFGALLILDDAHGTGVLGEGGAGTAAHFGLSHEVDLTMGTFSKAFGMVGGFVTGDAEIIEYLRYFSRPYMFSASLPPVVVAGILAGLDVLASEPELRQRLKQNVCRLVAGLSRLCFDVRVEAAIVTLRVPAELVIGQAMTEFERRGIFLNAVEYPAVPLSEQRFRISVMATHEPEDIDALLEAIGEIFPRVAL